MQKLQEAIFLEKLKHQKMETISILFDVCQILVFYIEFLGQSSVASKIMIEHGDKFKSKIFKNERSFLHSKRKSL